jgi:transcriptional regulator with XRE-family HTH domain
MAGSVKLGRKLKAARKAKRMTLMEVQKKAGVSATHISQIGKRNDIPDGGRSSETG